MWPTAKSFGLTREKTSSFFFLFLWFQFAINISHKTNHSRFFCTSILLLCVIPTGWRCGLILNQIDNALTFTIQQPTLAKLEKRNREPNNENERMKDSKWFIQYHMQFEWIIVIAWRISDESHTIITQYCRRALTAVIITRHHRHQHRTVRVPGLTNAAVEVNHSSSPIT